MHSAVAVHFDGDPALAALVLSNWFIRKGNKRKMKKKQLKIVKKEKE